MPALYLFGRRTLLGGDDLQVPALVTTIVRGIQLSFLVLPLGIFIWKQALIVDSANGNSNTSRYEWPVMRYLFDWWNELEATASQNNNEPPECAKSAFARYYPLLSALHLIFTVFFCIHSLFLEYKIWHWSCQGTPTMRQPRTKNVQELLEKKLGICTVLLALIVGCTYYVAAVFFARPYHVCFRSMLEEKNNEYYYYDNGVGEEIDAANQESGNMDPWVGSRAWYALGILLAISQTTEVVVAALFCARLKASETNAAIAPSQTSTIQHFHHELMEELWADRCESFFRCLSISTCFLFGGKDLMDNAQRNNSYKHVAQALADYLETKGTLDVVPTDIFTGLFVLQRIQKQRILQTRRTVSQESSSLLASSQTHIVGLRAASASSSSSSPSSAATPEPPHSPTHTIDHHYHQISTPENISKTGLRSRVASTNDLRARVPTPGKATSHSAPPSLGNPLSTTQAGQPSSLSSSSLIRTPPPPSQHLQQIQGVRHQHHQINQRNIYRRNNSSDAADYDDPLRLVTSNTGESSFYRATSRQVLNPFDSTDAATLEEGARMCKYALSIYTWMLYVFTHPITGFPRLVCPCGRSSSETGMTNCCCKFCGILINPTIDRNFRRGSPLRRRRHSPPPSTTPNGNHDTHSQQREPLNSGMISSRRSSEGSVESYHDAIETGNARIHSEDDGEFHQDFVYGNVKTSGDTFCEWHKRALLLVAGIPEADLVYAEFNNKLSSVPYCILLDHEQSLVVLSIRGSLSLEDIVTDVLIMPESLEEVGNKYGFDGRGQYCHAGVLACFENVWRDLQKHRWLERLLEEQYPEYSLRIVGHSLGAGVSALLGYVLRSRYPSLKVFGYSPPGCTMTWEMANGCQDFVTTFILDSDIVPRLSVLAMEDLRDEVLTLIGRIKVPKHEVYQNFWKNRRNTQCLFGRSNSNIDEGANYDYEDDLEELTETINETLDEVPSNTTYQRQLLDFLRVQAERKQTRGETSSKSLRLYPPGKMIHLVRTGQESGCSHYVNQCLTCFTSNSGFVYTPVYISNDDLDEIVVTSTMGTDHFIDRMCDELHTLSEKYCSELHNGGREAAAYPCGIGSGNHQIV